MTLTSHRAVVFDLDGTLIDSRRDIAAAANRALARHGLPERTLEDLVSFVGDGASTLLARAANRAEDDPLLPKLLATFLDDYRLNALVETRLLPGAFVTLTTLSEALPIALCTNKPRICTTPILEGLGIARFFGCVVAGDDVARKKPAPDPLLFAAGALGVSATDCVMVGDGPQDVLAAHAAGMMSIGIAGMAAPQSLAAARPTFTVDSLDEIPRLLAVAAP